METGESVEATVNHRSLALLAPRSTRPRTMGTRDFLAGLAQADPALSSELAAELTETTNAE